ncbi:MAG: hypothetical protein ACJAZ3_000220 [Sphingobacteriales bacterium]|jgi:hypothetical protein
MKKGLLTIIASFLVAAFTFAQEGGADFTFEKEVHDFGTVIEGDKAKYEFKFTNTGTEPLVLTAVNASCGCTTPEWTKEPVAAGATGIITVIYNSKNRPGPFNKSITIMSNAKTPRKVIYIKGKVEKGTASDDGTPANENSGPTE